MRLLDRYLFCELLTPLAYCLVGFLLFGISYDLFSELEELQEHKLHTLDILGYVLAITPQFLVTILPIALLLALLYTLTNHARHNEITAMRAAGVSLWRVCVPYLIVGLATGAALFALNEIVAPRAADWADRILNRYVPKPNDNAQDQFHGFANQREHRLWHFNFYNVKTAKMLNPQVNWKLPDGSSYQLNAARAIRTNGEWVFFDAKEEFSPANATEPPVPVELTNANALAMPQFDETPAQIESEIKIRSYQNHLSTRQADIPLADILGYLRLHPDLPRDESAWLLTKFYGRLAAPWTCVVVVLIAIPFGATTGRRNLFFGVAGSIFICFTFFVLQSVSLAFGSGGELPAWLAAWLPNIFFAATGLFLMARVR
ncbi:MAG TPA: LptF/LptG family permease [Candidatus Aquilonibacter sp.]|nr:LptF/LptG family permease [Candidatus Aquilonibacter sp.]